MLRSSRLLNECNLSFKIVEKLHSVQGLQCMIKKSSFVVLFTSDVMYN